MPLNFGGARPSPGPPRLGPDGPATGAAAAGRRRAAGLYVEVPFTPYYLPPADGLYLVLFGPAADPDEADAFWYSVLGDDAGLIDDPDAALAFVDAARETYRRRIAAGE